MILNKSEIARELAQGSLVVQPYREDLVRSASYLLRLGNRFRRWRAGAPIRPGDADDAELLDASVCADSITLAPREFVLGVTLEKISLPTHLVGLLTTPSHFARFGVWSVLSSSLVRPGFGTVTPTALTLELHSVNPSPLILRYGDPICRVSFLSLSAPIPDVDASAYEGLDAPSPSQLSQIRRPEGLVDEAFEGGDA